MYNYHCFPFLPFSVQPFFLLPCLILQISFLFVALLFFSYPLYLLSSFSPLTPTPLPSLGTAGHCIVILLTTLTNGNPHCVFNITRQCSVCIIREKYIPECCCMWSNRLLQSTSMSTVAPVSRGDWRKWTAVGPLRVTRSTSTPAIWGRHGNETWWSMGMRLSGTWE